MTESSTTTPSGKPDIFETRESAVRSYCRSWPATFAQARRARSRGTRTATSTSTSSPVPAHLNYGHNNPAVMGPLIEYLQSGAVLHSHGHEDPGQA